MKDFISINTVTDMCSTSLFLKGKFIESIENEERFSHTKILAVSIQNILKSNQLEGANLDFISLSVGPGSYSGIKVGVSFIKGFSLATKIPIVPVNQFLCFNNQIKDKGYYYICLYSHRDNVFYQLYKNGEPISEQICSNFSDLNPDYNIYGYNLDMFSDINYIKIDPSSKDIGLYAYENYNSLLIKDPDKLESIYLVKKV